jgi:hypothetical protein
MLRAARTAGAGDGALDVAQAGGRDTFSFSRSLLVSQETAFGCNRSREEAITGDESDQENNGRLCLCSFVRNRRS